MRRVRAKLAPESQAKRKLARPFAGFDGFSSTKREDFLWASKGLRKFGEIRRAGASPKWDRKYSGNNAARINFKLSIRRNT